MPVPTLVSEKRILCSGFVGRQKLSCRNARREILHSSLRTHMPHRKEKNPDNTAALAASFRKARTLT
jgi:hypothetical protein